MASSNDFGMPVTNSPPNRDSASTQGVSPWMGTAPAHAAANKLAKGPTVALPVVGESFGSLNDVRIRTMAHAMQNGWSASTATGVRIRAGLEVMKMICQYGSRKWGGFDGGCQFRVEASERSSDGLVEVLKVNGRHCTHELGEAPPSPISSKKVQSVWPSTRDAKAYIEDGSTDSSSNSNSDDNANPDQKTLSIKPSIKRNPLSVVRPNEIDIRARALIASGNARLDLIGYGNVDPTEVRVQCAAYALANGFVLQLNTHSASVHSFRCHKSSGRQKAGVERCIYSVHVTKQVGGEEWVVDEIKGEHNHDLNENVTRESLGGGGGRERGRVVGAVSGAQKRVREEEDVVVKSAYNPRIGAIKGPTPAPRPYLPPFSKQSTNANAVGSGSGSKGTVATQYSGSSSQRRLPPSSTAATTTPRLPAPLFAAPRPWPVELARLIAIANTVLLDLSHVFAAIFIEAGVVNRYEFSKLLWTFSSENMKDERMLWFIERLLEERNGIALSRLQVIQFRSGAKRLFARIVAETAKK